VCEPRHKLLSRDGQMMVVSPAVISQDVLHRRPFLEALPCPIDISEGALHPPVDIE
jgi:hypothetical protein